jgi:hypothetical protein
VSSEVYGMNISLPLLYKDTEVCLLTLRHAPLFFCRSKIVVFIEESARLLSVVQFFEHACVGILEAIDFMSIKIE